MLIMTLLLSSGLAAAPISSDNGSAKTQSSNSISTFDTEEDTTLAPTEYAQVNGFCLGCWQQMACMGFQSIDQSCFDGKLTRIYQHVINFTGIGSAIGFVGGALLGILPGGYFGFGTYQETLARGETSLGAIFQAGIAFLVTVFVFGLVASIALGIVGAAVGLIWGFYKVVLTPETSEPVPKKRNNSNPPPPTRRRPLSKSQNMIPRLATGNALPLRF